MASPARTTLRDTHGIRRIAVLEKGYIGSGNTGRNTTIIRSNYLTPEGVRFYDRSVQLWRNLGPELGLNLFYSTRGHYTLAHTDATLRTLRWRAEVNKHLGVDSRMVGPEEISRALPMMDMTAGGHAPILGALLHAPGAVARHDAVAWGYARAADRLGVEIHQQTRSAGHQHGRRPRHRCAHFARRHRHRHCRVRGGRLHAPHPEDAGPDQPDLRASAAGHGLRAAQALARSDHRFRIAACLRLADRARRTGDGRIAGSARTAHARARAASSPPTWRSTCWTCSPSSPA